MQTIEVTGGNLYALAAQYLKDASQWIRIAIQNGLTDPFLNVATLPPRSQVFRATGQTYGYYQDEAGNVITLNGGPIAVPIGVFVLEIPDIDLNATGGVPAQ